MEIKNFKTKEILNGFLHTAIVYDKYVVMHEQKEEMSESEYIKFIEANKKTLDENIETDKKLQSGEF